MALGQRRVENSASAEAALEPVRDLEHAPLSLHLLERLFARGVRDVLAEEDDAGVPVHLVT